MGPPLLRANVVRIQCALVPHVESTAGDDHDVALALQIQMPVGRRDRAFADAASHHIGLPVANSRHVRIESL